MQEEANTIGVFDSGVGGLTVLRELLTVFPQHSLIYLGDTARVPYGTKSAQTIRRYARQCTQFLLSHNVSMVIVACNTASAIALDAVQQMAGVPVVGTIEPAVDAALQHSSGGHIGIIGTHATVASGAYQQLLSQKSNNARTNYPAEACRLFVPLAEEGWQDQPAVHMIAERYLRPMRSAGIDTLILGCTHYPLLINVIQAQLPQVKLINSGAEAARRALQALHPADSPERRSSPQNFRAPDQQDAERIRCFVTDKVDEFSCTATRFLGFAPKSIELTTLEDT